MNADKIVMSENNLPELLRIIAYPSMYRKDLEAAADLIETLQAQLAERDKEIERLRKAQRWIPVSERLPEIDKEYGDVDVLVYTDEGIIEATTYDKDAGWGLWVEAGEVTHWMPLPAPPEKGAEHE